MTPDFLSFSPNFYILDEPTNHLDMETIEALAKALNKFKVGSTCLCPCSPQEECRAGDRHRGPRPGAPEATWAVE